MTTGAFVSYLRVSTVRQGASGLGLEAQRQAVDAYLNGGDARLLATFIETESGKDNARPQLAAALSYCRATGAVLIVAKLDRLARNVAFLAALMDSGTEFVAVDQPFATRLTIHILAAVAEHEGKAISARTQAAMNVVKATIKRDGTYRTRAGRVITRMGCPIGAQAFGDRRGVGNIEAVKAKADAHAAKVLPIVETIRAAGIASLHGIAAELTRRGVLTARGGQWNATSVRNLLARSR